MRRIPILLFMVLLAAPLLAGCHRSAQFTFVVDPGINEDQLVQVDIVATSRDSSREILQIDPEEWFGSEFRRNLSEDQIRTVALRPGETREIERFKGPKGTDTFIVIAEIRGATDPDARRRVFHPGSGSRRFVLEIRDNRLDVRERQD